MGRSARRPELTRRWPSVAFGGALVVLLVAFAGLIRSGEQQARDALAARFETRASLSAAFARTYIDDLARHETAQAEHFLADRSVAVEDFDRVVEAFGFEAAVLLDADGRLLHVWPAMPELIGKDMTVEYAHLRTAVGGQTGVSQVVPSAAQALPVVAVAVPFETPAGRRVFSGAFLPSTTPLGTYLSSVVPVTGGSTVLVDEAGVVLASSASSHADIDLAGRAMGVAEVDSEGGRVTTAVADVEGLRWRVVLMAPSDRLYGPLESRAWSAWLLLLALALCGVEAGILFSRLRRSRTTAAQAALSDPLTGLSNRRAMQQGLDQAAALVARHRTPVAVLMIDIDRFKAVNDTFGHGVGDVVIGAVAATLTASIRDVDLAARWGGEEFLVLLHHTDRAGALTTAERIRSAIAAASLPACMASGVTASIGVAVLDGDVDTAVRRADAALYVAKANGRNRVEVDPVDDTIAVDLHDGAARALVAH